MLRQRGDYEAEVALYDEVIELYPHHHSTLVALGDAQLALEDIDGSIATFEAIEQRYPDDLQSAVRLGYLLFEARRFDEADGRFERVLAANPEEYEVAFFLGVVHRRRGDGDGAIRAFESIPDEAPLLPGGTRADRRGAGATRATTSEALAEIERANAVRPAGSSISTRRRCGRRPAISRGPWRAWSRCSPRSPRTTSCSSTSASSTARPSGTDEAIVYMRRALEENPDNASALNYIGYTWAERASTSTRPRR